MNNIDWYKLLYKAHEEWENQFNKVMLLRKEADRSKSIHDYLKLREKADFLDKKITDKLDKFHEKFIKSI